MNVPMGAFKFKTRSGANYEISAPNAQGMRSVKRDGKPVVSGRVTGSGLNALLVCELTRPNEIVKGLSIIIETGNADKPIWASTEIVKIEV